MFDIKLYLIFILLMTSFLKAQEDEFSSDTTAEQPTTITEEVSDKDIFTDKTSIEKPTKLRDPFKSPVIKKKSDIEAKREKTLLRNGVFTNLPTLDLITLDNVKVSGTLLGVKPRVLIADKSNPRATIMAKEGDKIGNGKVELKAILPRGVVFVEQITNVYGQFEYLETVVPISD